MRTLAEQHASLREPRAGLRKMGRDIPPPRWLYLTDAYVRAASLEEGPVFLPRKNGMIQIPMNGGKLNTAAPKPHPTGVTLDGWPYLRHPGGGWAVFSLVRY